MESDSKKSIYNHLNEHLWVEILKRFPAKTLCQFRGVSKSWDSLISSSLFIICQHLSTNNDVDNDFGKSYLMWLYHTSSYAFYNSRVSLVEYPKFLKNIPFQTLQSRHFTVVDAIHGVVCLSNSNSIILWNPTIHKFVEIPPSFSCPTTSSSHALGFGFNGVGNHDYDFKVVRIWAVRHTYKRNRVKPSEPLQSPRYEVYSTRGSRWRTVFAGHIDPCALVSGGCFAKGSIHWIISRYVNGKYEMELLMFDCKSEELKTLMKLPREFNKCRSTSLFTYRGLLSVLMAKDFEEIELWAMEEYRVASSWKKLSMIHHEEDFVLMWEHDVYHYRDRRFHPRNVLGSSHLFKELRVKEPLMGHLLEESMFLMEAKWQAQSYT